MPDKRTFVLTITTDYPDAEESARAAAAKVACEIGWGDDNTSSIELTENTGSDHPTHMARWDFEPGSQSSTEDEHFYVESGTGERLTEDMDRDAADAEARRLGQRLIGYEPLGATDRLIWDYAPDPKGNTDV
jgi:hypothetical protein